MSKIIKKFAELIPDFNTDHLVFVDPPRQVQKQVQVEINEADFSEVPIISGARFPSKKSDQTILKQLELMMRQKVIGETASFTFHLKGGLLFDIQVSAPYQLMKRNPTGEIVRVKMVKKNERAG